MDLTTSSESRNSLLGAALGDAWEVENKPHTTHPHTQVSIAAMIAAFAGLAEKKVGTYEGTGAALDVDCGFDPQVVIAFNRTDGDAIYVALGGGAFSIIGAAGPATSVAIALGAAGERKFEVSGLASESGKTFDFLALG